jgi:hypothetical protein
MLHAVQDCERDTGDDTVRPKDARENWLPESRGAAYIERYRSWRSSKCDVVRNNCLYFTTFGIKKKSLFRESYEKNTGNFSRFLEKALQSAQRRLIMKTATRSGREAR